MTLQSAIVLVLGLAGINGDVRLADEHLVKSGDLVVLQMTGDLAVTYAWKSDGQQYPADSGLQIETTAWVSQRLENGCYRIEHNTRIAHTDPPQLLTLTALVDPKQFQSDELPIGTRSYRSPDDHRKGVVASVAREKRTMLRLGLSRLQDVTIRIWKLREEIVD